MKRIIVLTLAVFTLGAAAEPAARRVTPPPTAGETVRARPARTSAALTFKTERAVVFKDGYGLVVKRGRATADEDGRVFTSQVPDGAILGAFWAAPVTRGIKVEAMRAETLVVERTLSETARCGSLPALLRAHEGKTATLVLDKEELTGRVAAVLDAAGLVIIDEGQRKRTLRIGAIRELRGALEATCTAVTKAPANEKRLTFELGKRAAGRQVELRLFYFAPGIRWIPTYRIHLDDDDGARVDLTGEILNELEDLDGPIDLVVGVPHFKFKGTPSPLSLERVLRNALHSAAPQLMGQSMSNAMFMNRSREVFEPSGAASAPADNPALRAAESHELFVYKVPRLVLPKGARAQVPLLQTGAKVKHVYTVDLNTPADASPDGVKVNGVWHNLELINTGSAPWTTGPALVMRGDLPLGQDLLTYTPRGGTVLLPVTQAVGVRAVLSDDEVKREAGAETIQRRTYTRVHRKALAKIHNLRGDAVEVRVKIRGSGKVQRPAGVRYGRGDAVNPRYTVDEVIRLKPGKARELTTTYTQLI